MQEESNVEQEEQEESEEVKELLELEFEEQEQVEEQEETEEVEEVVEEEKLFLLKNGFSKLVKGLTKTRNNIMDGIDNVLKSFTKIDEELYEELEEALIMADIGVDATLKIMDGLREKVKEKKITDPAELKKLLVEEITEILNKGNRELNISEGPAVILVIGVNGVGKTTTIGKLAHVIKKIIRRYCLQQLIPLGQQLLSN